MNESQLEEEKESRKSESRNEMKKENRTKRRRKKKRLVEGRRADVKENKTHKNHIHTQTARRKSYNTERNVDR